MAGIDNPDEFPRWTPQEWAKQVETSPWWGEVRMYGKRYDLCTCCGKLIEPRQPIYWLADRKQPGKARHVVCPARGEYLAALNRYHDAHAAAIPTQWVLRRAAAILRDQPHIREAFEAILPPLPTPKSTPTEIFQ